MQPSTIIVQPHTSDGRKRRVDCVNVF